MRPLRQSLPARVARLVDITGVALVAGVDHASETFIAVPHAVDHVLQCLRSHQWQCAPRTPAQDHFVEAREGCRSTHPGAEDRAGPAGQCSALHCTPADAESESDRSYQLCQWGSDGAVQRTRIFERAASGTGWNSGMSGDKHNIDRHYGDDCLVFDARMRAPRVLRRLRRLSRVVLGACGYRESTLMPEALRAASRVRPGERAGAVQSIELLW